VSRAWLTNGRKRSANQTVESLKQGVVDTRVLRIRRYGKFLLWDLSNGHSLMLHMGMSGTLLLGYHQRRLPRGAAALFLLDGGASLLFQDPRRFGDMRVLLDSDAFLRQWGPDPLQSSFTLQLLQGRLRGKTAPIKVSLCDQKVIAGIGNIYSNEILFQAGIHPLAPSGSLSETELESLFFGITGVLQEAVEQGGTTLEDKGYQTPFGRMGQYRPRMYFEGFRTLERDPRGDVPDSIGIYNIDKACPTCGTQVRYLRLGQRAAFFCPRCQPELPRTVRG
jgi:formamidopyrimidine-DNA glycosylase